jgi:hypothetical protein
MESVTAGTMAGTGSFRCEECDYVVSLAASDELPSCPACGGTSFVRASLFTTDALGDEPLAGEEHSAAWLAEARDALEEPGHYLAYESGERTVIFPLSREWTRLGRSLAADIRFDDPTVSRRHALIVRGPDGVRVLDDRSLNGVWVNGTRVEWSTLVDGDEILLGRHRLHVLEVTETGSGDAAGSGDSGSLLAGQS